MTEPHVILTPVQVAERLAVPVGTVVMMCASGRLPGAKKFGRRWRIPEAALRAYFAAPDGAPPPVGKL